MKLNFKVISSFLGLLLMLNGLFMLGALIPSLIYNEKSWQALCASGLGTVLTGFILWFIGKGHQQSIGKREGFLIVTMGWLLMSLTGCLPYLSSGTITYFSGAFFETVSGYTTTGASVLNDIEAVDKGVLMWRSTTHWIGGMGIIVLTIAILPILGIGGMQLFSAEAPGPASEKLHPRITQTAKRLWLIYVALTLILLLLLKLAGMNWFDAVNHAFATVSTGGFSTKNLSLAHYNNNHLIQGIIIVFMFLAGVNFSLIYFSLKGKLKRVIQDEEFRFFIALVVLFSVVCTLVVYNNPPAEGWDYPLRDSVFQVVAVITTTGFVSADLTLNPILTTVFFFLMFLGGSAGSTAGGIKLVRHLIIIKNSIMELKRLLHPSAIIPVKYNQRSVRGRITFNIMAFVIIYFLIFVFSAFVFALNGESFITAIGGAASSLGNVGPATGKLCPTCNYSGLSSFGKYFSSMLMLIGRLEIFTVLILFTPFFWRKY